MALFERKQPVEYLIVGLGNPGREYERTRHNVGFMALDYIAGRIGADIRDLKQMALTGRGVLEGRRVLLVKPQTYMNRSGESVGALLRYYKLTPDRLIVVYDDVSMALGKLRVRLKGSAGGHNGVKSIIETVGDEWARVKLDEIAALSALDYQARALTILQKFLPDFTADELKAIQDDYERIYAAVACLLSGEAARAMECCNG
mgnify:CR=1 FL=1